MFKRLGFGLTKKSFYYRINHKNRYPIWIHGVSAGEINSSRYLVDKLQSLYYPIYLTTSTQEGLDIAKQIESSYPQSVRVDIFPLDIPYLCRKMIRIIKPSMMILLECELWPHFLLECYRNHIITLLVNGRLHAKELKHYQYAASLFKQLLEGFSFVSVQSQTDAVRFCELGVPKHRIYVDGNIKINSLALQHLDLKLAKKHIQRHLHKDNTTILAASVHSKEQHLILNSFQYIKRIHAEQSITLIMVPRKQKSIPNLVRHIQKKQLSSALWSHIKKEKRKLTLSCIDILIIDTMGELFSLYPLADIVILGGTLEPHIGGHNLMEPLYHNKATIVGPFDESIRWLSIVMEQCGGLYRIATTLDKTSILEIELTQIINQWISFPEKRLMVCTQAKKHMQHLHSPGEKVYQRLLTILSNFHELKPQD